MSRLCCHADKRMLAQAGTGPMPHPRRSRCQTTPPACHRPAASAAGHWQGSALASSGKRWALGWQQASAQHSGGLCSTWRALAPWQKRWVLGLGRGLPLSLLSCGTDCDRWRATQVSLPSFDVGLPAYYVIATSEASSNLSRFDGVRYGLRHEVLRQGNTPLLCSLLTRTYIASEHCFRQEGNIREMYNATRGEGLNAEVKRRILMGTYALSAGYYDAYYKRAQQARPRCDTRTRSSDDNPALPADAAPQPFH